MQKNKIIIITAFLLLHFAGIAQQRISLDRAIEIAQSQNGLIRSANLQKDYQTALINTYKEIPATAFGLETGQVNSNYIDTKFNLEQEILPAGYYKANKRLLETEVEQADVKKALQLAELKREVRLAFYDYQYYTALVAWHNRLDSIWKQSVQRAESRQKLGEDNALELSLAQLNFQRNKYRSDRAVMMQNLSASSFAFWMNNNQYLPEITSLEVQSPHLLDTNWSASPMVREWVARKNFIQATKQYERAKLLPTYRVGYVNQSFRGTGPDGTFYKGLDRMHAVVGGVNIPLFAKAQKLRINTFKIQEQMADVQMEYKKFQLTQQLDLLQKKWAGLQTMQKNYQQLSEPKILSIVQLSYQQLKDGEINFLQYAAIVKEVSEDRFYLLSIQKELTETAVEISYLLNL